MFIPFFQPVAHHSFDDARVDSVVARFEDFGGNAGFSTCLRRTSRAGRQRLDQRLPQHMRPLFAQAEHACLRKRSQRATTPRSSEGTFIFRCLSVIAITNQTTNHRGNRRHGAVPCPHFRSTTPMTAWGTICFNAATRSAVDQRTATSESSLKTTHRSLLDTWVLLHPHSRMRLRCC